VEVFGGEERRPKSVGIMTGNHIRLEKALHYYSAQQLDTLLRTGEGMNKNVWFNLLT
jgi:hypothetical protein